MIQHTLKKLPKRTYEIDVTIPWSEIQTEYSKSFDALHQNLTVEGYRKGKAPKQIAEKHIKQDAVYNHLIRGMLPKIYDDIVKKEDLKPVMSPKIDLKSAKENEDWQVVMSVAEKPEIDLGDYKKTVTDAKAEAKKDEIWVPGKEEKKPENPEAENQKKLNEILAALLQGVKCEISDLILEEELEGRLARLVDDIQKLGLTVDAYLKSRNLSMEDLRAQYKKEIEDTYKLEFILAEIAEKENITVDNKELEALFTHIKDEKERQAAQSNAYFYASILRKQKVLDFLISL
jgi:trigger factor